MESTKEYAITPAIIYAATDGGMDIIEKYIPEARKGQKTKNYKFRSTIDPDHDPSPSSVVYEFDKVWFIKSFQTGKVTYPIQLVCEREKLNFGEAINYIAKLFNINGEKVAKSLGPKYAKRKPEPTEIDGQMDWEVKEFTIDECQKIFAINVWKYLCSKPIPNPPKGTKVPEDKTDERGLHHAKLIFAKYNFKSLAWQSIVKIDKDNKKEPIVNIFTATPAYPIFVFDMGDWQKFYKPAAAESRYRFSTYGTVPKDFVLGKKQCEQAFDLKQIGDEDAEDLEEELSTKTEQDEDEEAEQRVAKKKLKQIIIATGGSDAFNLIAFGFQVVWFNSETIKKEIVPFKRLTDIAHTIYYVGDMDKPGRDEAYKIGIEFLDLNIVDLPSELSNTYDRKGKKCKDIKDYFQTYYLSDFQGILNLACPFKFWSEKKKYVKGKVKKINGKPEIDYEPDNELIYNFLQKHGYGRFEVSNEKDKILVQIDTTCVKKPKYEDLREFLKNFLRSRGSERKLINTFHRSPQLSDSSLSSLKTVQIDFSDTGKNYQYMFFENRHWKVSADKIETFATDKSGKMVWEDEVIKHDVTVLDKLFTISKEGNNYDLKFSENVANENHFFMKYLINTCRVHWRNELEFSLENLPIDEQKKYLAENHSTLDGSLLSADEKQEHYLHFLNKITSIGYLLHRYKENAQGYWVWAMDYAMTVGQSYGGTGKSIAYNDGLKHIMKTLYIEGRKPDIAQNQFLFAGVNEHTDLVYIDDGHEYLETNRFFSIVTGSMETIKKGMDPIIIDFQKTPKLCITSNFPPRATDSATQRRMWFTAFSDFFHKNPNGEYRESRDPKEYFGLNLFLDFSEKDWNEYLNFMAQCIQAWLTFGKIDPPMKIVMQNTYRNKMGGSFLGWANNFWGDTTEGKLNKYVQRSYAFKDYQIETGDTKSTAQTFFDRMNYWCLYNNYKLNPPDLHTTKDGRISIKQIRMRYHQGAWGEPSDSPKESMVCIYIRAKAADGTTPKPPIEKEIETIEPPALDFF